MHHEHSLAVFWHKLWHKKFKLSSFSEVLPSKDHSANCLIIDHLRMWSHYILQFSPVKYLLLLKIFLPIIIWGPGWPLQWKYWQKMIFLEAGLSFKVTSVFNGQVGTISGAKNSLKWHLFAIFHEFSCFSSVNSIWR